MVVSQIREGRYQAVSVNGKGENDAQVIFCKDKNRVVIKLQGIVIIVENKSLKELNNE